MQDILQSTSKAGNGADYDEKAINICLNMYSPENPFMVSLK